MAKIDWIDTKQVLENFQVTMNHKTYLELGEVLYGNRISLRLRRAFAKIANSFMEEQVRTEDLGPDYDPWADLFLEIIFKKYYLELLEDLQASFCHIDKTMEETTLACLDSCELLRNYLCREFFSECEFTDFRSDALDQFR